MPLQNPNKTTLDCAVMTKHFQKCLESTIKSGAWRFILDLGDTYLCIPGPIWSKAPGRAELVDPAFRIFTTDSIKRLVMSNDWIHQQPIGELYSTDISTATVLIYVLHSQAAPPLLQWYSQTERTFTDTDGW